MAFRSPVSTVITMLASLILFCLISVSNASPHRVVDEPAPSIPTTTITISPVPMPVEEVSRCLSSSDLKAAKLHDYYPLCNVDISEHNIFPYLWVGSFDACLETCDAFNEAQGEDAPGDFMSDMPMSPEVYKIEMRGEDLKCKAALFLPERFAGENDCYLKWGLDGALRTKGSEWIIGGVKRMFLSGGGIIYNGTTSTSTAQPSTGTGMPWSGNGTIGAPTMGTASQPAGTGHPVTATSSANASETSFPSMTTSANAIETGNSTVTSSSSSHYPYKTSSFSSSSMTFSPKITVHNSRSSEDLTLPTKSSSAVTVHNSRSSEDLTLLTESSSAVTVHNSRSSEELTLPTESSSVATIQNSRSHSILTLPTRVYNHDF